MRVLDFGATSCVSGQLRNVKFRVRSNWSRTGADTPHSPSKSVWVAVVGQFGWTTSVRCEGELQAEHGASESGQCRGVVRVLVGDELQHVLQDKGPRARQRRMDRCNALLSEHLLEVYVWSSRCGCVAEEFSEWLSASNATGDLLLAGRPGLPSAARKVDAACAVRAALPERRHHDSWRVDGHSEAAP